MTIPPKKFVGLHSHSTFSIGDAIGTPADHIKFAIKNGMDALALTDHGNMNGVSHQLLAAEKLKKEGINFKAIPGVEAYFLPSLKDWAALKERRAEEKLAEKNKKAATKAASEPEQLDLIGDPLATTKQELDAITAPDEEESGTVVENEEESKSSKVKDPLYQRNHLVLLPKNSAGLKALYRLVSTSYMDGFYRYPRMDFEMLKREAQGNIIASSACIAGYPAKVIFDFQKETDWTKWGPSLDNFEEIQTALAKSIAQFKDALGEENYYLEIQFNRLGAQHLVNYHLIEAAKRTNTKLVATADAHYSDPNHWRERELYKLMAWMNKTKGDLDSTSIPQKIEELKCELYPKNAQQMWESYKAYSQGYDFYDDQTVADAIERTWTIAHEQIGEIKPDKTVKLPVLEKLVSLDQKSKLEKENPEASEDDLAYKELVRLAKAGLLKKNKASQDYIDRLRHELQVIKELKFAKYFLTYAKIMEVVSSHMLIGNARGSAGGSLLSYCLGITQLDPLRFGTLFERFLVRGKKGFPDIDSDFGDRELATQLIAEYFGEENVLSVSNFSQLQVASLIKDLAKVYSVPFDEVNTYTNKMRNEAMAKAKQEPGFDAQVWQFTVEVANRDSPSFREFMVKMEKYPAFKTALDVLFKQMRNVSRHAGGLIITNKPRENMPIIKSGGKLQTPWPEGLNFRHLEEFGFLKFDILGLGTLRMFENCIRKIIKRETGMKHVPFNMIREWFWTKLHPDNNDLADMNVYKSIYWNNRYAGVFQFVKKNVQNFMAEMKPVNVVDIAIATSLFRPGPMGIGADKMYLENRLNPGHVRYKHPLLKEVLADTSGLIVFQEQLQLIYHKLAGVPLEDTDAVRKAFTKKDISNKEKAAKDREVMREDFANRCLAVNQIEKRVSYDIFDEMEKFVAYSFNKSHAVAYAITSYQCAWFLTYYPDEWIATYIDYSATEKGKVAGKEDPKVIALNEAKALGYNVGKPDINLSTNEYILKGKTLIPSFAALKYVGATVVREMDDYRPYKTLEDLLWTKNLLHTVWRHSKFNKRALSTLVKMEAFDSLGLVGPDKTFKNYRQMYEVVVEQGDTFKKALARKKNRNHEELLKQAIADVQNLPDWTTEEKLKFQAELSGSIDLGLICTPDIELFLAKNDVDSIENWESENQSYWAIVNNSSIAITKTGKKYLKLSLMGSDGSIHTCNVWAFGNTMQENEKIQKHSIIIAPFQKNDFGLSTNLRRVYRVKADSAENMTKAVNDYED